MSHDPFKVTDRTCLQLSGGRTSAYMLWRTLQANGGKPDDLVVCFENTGREDEATLRFVHEIESRWGVPIVWLEYRKANDPADRWQQVSFETASRNGEPFAAAIEQRQYLPNPVTRFCTVELKIRTAHRYLRSIGWFDDDEGWDQFVGIRADEQRRVAKIRARPSPEIVRETMCMPLADAGVTVQEVNDFWSKQPFNLELLTVNGRTLAGNCDLCFLKPTGQRLALIKEQPERAVWWIQQEARGLSSKPSGARFRSDAPSYAQLAAFARDQHDLFDADEEGISCLCGD